MDSKEFITTILGTITVLTSCCSTLIWQIILVGLIFYFRSQITALLSRIGTVKVGGTEIAFQQPSSEAMKPGGVADSQIEFLQDSGFFTREGITSLIANSGLISKSEKVIAHLLIFQTKKQHTWLVTTNKNLFCILDDESTQANGKLIQWKLPLTEATPITAKAYKTTIGLVSIGVWVDWFYSRRLYPNKSDLEQEIKNIIEKSQKNAG